MKIPRRLGMHRVNLLFTMTIFSLCGYSQTGWAITQSEREFFESKIRPVLIEHCYECHNSHDKQKGDLALDWKTPLMKGGESGEVIVPGDPDDSVLIWSLRHEEDYKMPSKAPKLDDAIIRDFEKWVRMGAPDPRTAKPTKEEISKGIPWPVVRDKRKKWWSFQPLEKTLPPAVKGSEWSKNGLDAFIKDRMDKQGLEPQPVAEPEVLVRRLHLILTGLLPQPEVVEAYLNDKSPDRYERLVDQLLASDAFGERWARHWMDWYRYAGTHGSEGDPPIPYVGEYRDYLIRALNEDVSYKQLLIEHLAGDLLKKPRVNKKMDINESAIGPANLRLVPHGFGVTDAYGEQVTFTDNQIDVISKAMMGLTVSCARCHDHKFDPISHNDFHRFYGVMISSRPTSVVIDTKEKQQLHKAELAALKSKIRKGLADYWLDELKHLKARLSVEGTPRPTIPESLKAKKGRKLNKQQRNQLNQIKLSQKAWDRENSSVLHSLALWRSSGKLKPRMTLAGLIQGHLKKLKQIKAANQNARKNAVFYMDLRDQKMLDQWYQSGNGLSPTVSPAGSFAISAKGKDVLTGIYPAGVYSHLISDKHAAVLSSMNQVAKGKRTMVRVVGRNAEMRVPIRNYPLTHGGLHPASIINEAAMTWLPVQKKWTYWGGEKVHYEFRTAKDIIPRAKGDVRSWFGVSEVIAGDEAMQNEGASLLSLLTPKQIEGIQTRDDLYRLYDSKLREVIDKWSKGKLQDKEAEFLNAFVRGGVLTQTLSNLPVPLQSLVNQYRKLEEQIPVPRRAPGVMEGDPTDQPFLARGDYRKEGKPVKRQFLEIFNNETYKQGSGRLELAADMVSPANTLKSRVLINRLWAYVFGRGIVASTDNFGRLGSKPTHPQLLDYLSLDFERHGFSIKHALKTMVMSRTFRSSSQTPEAVREHDPLNLYLSYYTPRRLDAEAILDNVRRLSGNKKRAVYDNVIRNRLDPFLQAFNAPVPTSTVSFRNSTNVPAQALAMLNGNLVRDASNRWAGRLNQSLRQATDAEKINAMFMTLFARQPSQEELVSIQKFLAQENRSLSLIAHALLNTKEFIYVY